MVTQDESIKFWREHADNHGVAYKAIEPEAESYDTPMSLKFREDLAKIIPEQLSNGDIPPCFVEIGANVRPALLETLPQCIEEGHEIKYFLFDVEYENSDVVDDLIINFEEAGVELTETDEEMHEADILDPDVLFGKHKVLRGNNIEIVVSQLPIRGRLPIHQDCITYNLILFHSLNYLPKDVVSDLVDTNRARSVILANRMNRGMAEARVEGFGSLSSLCGYLGKEFEFKHFEHDVVGCNDWTQLSKAQYHAGNISADFAMYAIRDFERNEPILVPRASIFSS